MAEGAQQRNVGAWRAEARATIALACPLVLTNVAQAAIHATDVVLLGWVGASTLAAGALGMNLYTACYIFGLGLVMAVAPMAARELGRRSHSVREVRRTVRQAMWAGAALCLPFWILLWNAAPVLVFLGQESALAAEAQKLVRALQWGMLPALLYIVLRSFVSALERPLWALVTGGIAVLFNAAVNSVLIFGGLGIPPLGLTGAGIGSTLTNLLLFGSLALIVVRHRRFRRYHLFGHFWRPDWPRFLEVWRLGLPIAVTLALEITIFNAAVFLMGLLGMAELAAHAIAIQIAALTFMVPLGISQAATVRVGLALGQGDRQGIARAGWTSFVLGVGFMALAAALMSAFPRTLVGLFLDPGSPADRAAFNLAISFLGVAALFQIVDGAQAVGAGMLRGLQDTTLPMLYAAFGYWVVGLSVGVGLGFGLGWRGIGIWTGLAVGLAVVAVLMVWRWTRRDQLGLVDRERGARS